MRGRYRVLLISLSVVAGLGTGVASSQMSSRMTPCVTAEELTEVPAQPPPPFIPDEYGLPKAPRFDRGTGTLDYDPSQTVLVPTPVSQELFVPPGTEFEGLDEVVLRTSCGLETLTAVSFSDGSDFYISAGVIGVDKLGPGRFLARWVAESELSRS